MNKIIKTVFLSIAFISFNQAKNTYTQAQPKWCGPCSGIAAGFLRDLNDLEYDLSSLIGRGNVILYFVNSANQTFFNSTQQVESTAIEYKNILFIKIDTQKFSDLQKQYYIKTIPTLLMYKGGSPIHIITGLIQKDSLKKTIKTIYSL